MNTPQSPVEKLLQLIDDLKLPVSLEDAQLHLKNLTATEIELLLPSFEEVKNYHESLGNEAKLADPQKYEELSQAFQKELKNLRTAYLSDTLHIQKSHDEKQDTNDVKNGTAIQSIIAEHTEASIALEKSAIELDAQLTRPSS